MSMQRGEEIGDEDDEEILARTIHAEIEEVERQFNDVKKQIKTKSRFNVETDEYVKEMKSLLNRTNANDDEDIEQFDTPDIIPKCPFTQTPIDDPVKNKHCHHTYSRHGAAEYIQMTLARKGKTRY